MGQKIIKNRKRSETLIADFDDIGYVIGWKFKVSASFKDALDIKLTDRTKEGVKKLVWTQGLIYDFQQGDSISDYRSTENWGHDLQHIKNYLQIENAIPCSIDEEITDVNGK